MLYWTDLLLLNHWISLYKKWSTHMCAYQGGKKCLFFGKFGVLCFLETPVLRFALFPCYRQINLAENGKNVSNDIDLCKIFNCFFSNIASEFNIPNIKFRMIWIQSKIYPFSRLLKITQLLRTLKTKTLIHN